MLSPVSLICSIKYHSTIRQIEERVILSYVIAGPIASRAINLEWKKDLAALSEELKKLCPSNQLILSTYDKECNASNLYELIVNEDPGTDTPVHSLRSYRNSVRNTTRMLTTVNSALCAVSNEFVVKTRIELLPKKHEIARHIDRILRVLNDMKGSPEITLTVLAENFGSSIYGKAGVMWALPDTFQIMRSKDMLSLWSEATKIWSVYKNMDLEIVHPLKNEQLIGRGYLKAFEGLDSLKFRNRFHFSYTLIALEHKHMKANIRIIESHELGLPKSRIIRSKGLKIIRLERGISYSTARVALRLFFWRLIESSGGIRKWAKYVLTFWPR